MNRYLPSLKSQSRLRPLRGTFRRPGLCVLALSLLVAARASAGIKAVGEAPVIDEQPIARTVTEGGHVTFSVQVHGTFPFAYQWSQNGQPLTNSTRVTGATNAVLNIDPTTNGDAGNYSVLITNTSGAAASAPVSLVVSQLLFQIIPMGGTGAVLSVLGQIGDVYRIEVSTNFGPYFTNGFATNFAGRAQFFDRDPGTGFRQLRVRWDRMLPVLYVANAEVEQRPLAAKAAAPTPGYLRAYGKLNQVWRFEGSSNLVQWFAIQTITNTSGWVKFIDPAVNPNDFIPDHRFYRIAPP